MSSLPSSTHLTEICSRRRIDKDPNNTKWARDTNSFGHKILRSQGWEPGQYLGAKNAPQAAHYTAANASFVRIALKDDFLGLGFKKAKEEQVTGMDAFQDMLARLNGKSEVAIQKEKQAKAALQTSLYCQSKFGPMRFVRGGWLVGDQEQQDVAPELKQKEGEGEKDAASDVSQERKSKKRKAAQLSDSDSSDSSSEDEKAKKKRRKEERRAAKKLKAKRLETTTSDETENDDDVSASRTDKKEKKRKSRSKSRDASSDTHEDVVKADSSSKAKKKSKKRKEKDSEESSDGSDGKESRKKRKKSKSKEGTASEPDKAAKKERKEKKKQKKESKSKRSDKDAESDESTTSAAQTSSNPTTGSSTPANTGSGTSTPVLRGHHAVRSKWIASKRMATLDDTALNQVCFAFSPLCPKADHVLIGM